MKNREKSITKNSVYYTIYQVMNVLFPFITSMYVARILLPSAVGTVAYAFNISSYFSILAFLGIPTYGLREISKVRHNPEALSKVYSELLVINAISTTCFGIAYLILIFSVAEFRSNLPLYLITGGSIVLNYLNNSWLFEGLEEFRFISIRNIVFKFVCFILLIVFVKQQSDYLIYASITVLGTAGNYFLNMAYAPRLVKFSLRGLNLKRHLQSIFALVVVNIAIELYSMVDTTMLGAISADENVAYYTYAQRIVRIFLQIINSFTIVVVPRLAYYFKEKRQEEFDELVSKTLETIVVLAVPLIVGIQIVGHDAIVLLYGMPFTDASPVLRILSFLLIISPIGYLLGSRMLLVTDHEKQMVICVGLGAIVNVIGNSVLIPYFAQIGAAVASVISEICVMVIYVWYGHKYYKLNISPKEVGRIIIGTIAMGVGVYFIGVPINHLLIKIIVQALVGMIIYFGILYIAGENMVREYGLRLKKKIHL